MSAPAGSSSSGTFAVKSVSGSASTYVPAMMSQTPSEVAASTIPHYGARRAPPSGLRGAQRSHVSAFRQRVPHHQHLADGLPRDQADDARRRIDDADGARAPLLQDAERVP